VLSTWSNPRGNNEEGFSDSRYSCFFDLDTWRNFVRAAGFFEPDDKIGLAAAYARVGNNARGLDVDTGLFGNFFFPVRSGETMFELMYQAQLAPWWTLQPEMQYIVRPAGGVLNNDGSLRPNAWVIAIRSSINF
jgi:porin